MIHVYLDFVLLQVNCMKYYEVLFNFALYFTYTILKQFIMDPALWMLDFNTVTGSNVFPDRHEIRFERFLLLYFKIVVMDISIFCNQNRWLVLYKL